MLKKEFWRKDRAGEFGDDTRVNTGTDKIMDRLFKIYIMLNILLLGC